MRRIKTKEDVVRKERKVQWIVGGILILLMVGSTLGYAMLNIGGGSEKEDEEYNGFEFVRDGSGFWKTEVNEGSILTVYHPQETEEIVLNFDLELSEIYGKTFYYAPESSGGISELFRNIEGFVMKFQEVCLEGRECNLENVPTKNCSSTEVFIFSVAEDIKIYKQENCIFIEAPLSEQAKASDRLVFDIFNIQ